MLENSATDVGEWAKWAWKWIMFFPGRYLCTRYPAWSRCLSVADFLVLSHRTPAFLRALK